MGYYFDEGKGVQRDLSEALRWYKLEAGDPFAAETLGNS